MWWRTKGIYEYGDECLLTWLTNPTSRSQVAETSKQQYPLWLERDPKSTQGLELQSKLFER